MRLAVDIAQVVGALALAGSVVFAAVQVKGAAVVSGLTVYSGLINQLDETVLTFVGRPDLRKYFYDDAEMPTDDDRFAEVHTLAEVFADVLANGLNVTEQLRRENRADFVEYTRFLVEHSPAVQYVIRKYPDWWPELLPYLPKRQP